ncbi:AAA family ATPase [Thiomicrorhabdus lithotrophica]|uniref:ATP-binding protein n=1 Tax=Thiomicrorhabdus lithotrophica TaxID=2949997 RepID=A0ABY8CA32_9GAMM|nr:ATP-binding protein [Thiomicrorhabdus lithotrophica]WEJ62826.1 ATP-binding protein [Thiomicrorhabdus lithotrophica]
MSNENIRMHYSSFRRAVDTSILSIIILIPSAVILYFWPDAQLTPYVLLGVGLFFVLISKPLFSIQGWKIRIYGIVEIAILYGAILLTTFFVKPEQNAIIWGVGGIIFHFTLSWMFANRTRSIEIWANDWHKPQYQRQTQMQQANNTPEQDGGVNPALEFPARKPRFTYKDVHGMEELKSNLSKTIHNFETEGGNGILLFGAPGNGKTFVAEAISGEIGVNFLEARTSELTSKWIGHTTEKINQVFEAAKLQAPCVLFLDEIDSFLMDRGDSSMNQDSRQSANTLLTSISELNKGYKEHGVLVLAATNFIDKLDEAGIREGRFDRKIKVYAPDKEARKGILLDGVLGQKIDEKTVEQVVSRWEGFSVARMRGIAKAAKRFAREENKPIDIDLLSRALRDVQGRMGEQIPEDALGLADLSFDENQKTALTLLVRSLAERHNIEAKGGQIPKGALFFGPPGTGKTTVAKALAKDLGWAYLSTSGHALLQKPEQIDKMIQSASDMRPAIVFIDEAEGLLGDRQINPHTKEITNKLLFAMDGERPLHDVFFIAATNHPDDVDSAMMRWGRFSEVFDLVMNENTLKTVVLKFIKERSEHVSFEGDIEAMVERMYRLGYSPADVKGCMTKSVNQAVMNDAVNDEHAKVNLDNLP